MRFPVCRMRRLREREATRRMVRETLLSVNDLVYPMFVVPGSGVVREIPPMPGVFHFSADTVQGEARSVQELGIPAVILFGLPEAKDPEGGEAWSDQGALQRAVRGLKDNLPGLVVITDVCLCEYTSHGHCGVVKGSTAESEGSGAGGAGGAAGVEPGIDNDPTLELLGRVALSHVRAGADMVAPSDMMDGRVGAIRRVLDGAGHCNVPIMSYAAKYASSFYGPFREAAGSAPQFGDRRSYQMDPANAREALLEVALDIDEGADIIMVKPALAYLDIVRRVRERFDLPLAVYNVSGEYSMVKAAAGQGFIDERGVVLESLLGMKRAGADLILTYHAKDVARWLAGSGR
ncbi:MAG: porphobilinogen synthase [Firmicutes bacterium]|nr:porphobilinogen synthase [Bacillota bacterium]